MHKALRYLVLLIVLLQLTIGALFAQQPRPQPTRQTHFVPNRVIIDPGPGQDWPGHELVMGQIEVPTSFPPVERTKSSSQWDYVIYDTLVLIYPNTYAGTIDASQVTLVKEQVRTARDFFWRNSHFKLYLNLDFLVIDDFVDASEFKSPWAQGWLWPNDDYDGDGESPEADMIARGIATDDYDSINLIWAHNGGTVAPAAGGLTWPYGWSWSDGGHTAITTNALLSAYGSYIGNPFNHEFQHSIDGAMALNGNENYFDADYPWKEPYRFGENWHFHAVEMRAWPVDDWFDLLGEWGRYATVPDADQDALPDSGDLPVTEASLGSSVGMPDSDGDGRSDRDEAMGGMFRATDLARADTDGDGLIDGLDVYPLYALKTYLPRKVQTIDGDPTGWTLLTGIVMESDIPFDAEVYGSWGASTLYLMIMTNKHAQIDIMLDGNGDGYWQGRDNYHFDLDTNRTGSETPLLYVGVNDCSPRQTSLKTYCQYDTDSDYTFGRLVDQADFGVKAVTAGGKHIVQLSIPADSDTRFDPRYQDEIGLRIYYTTVDNKWPQQAWSFETDEQVYLPLLTDDTGLLHGQLIGLGACDKGSDPLVGENIIIQGEKGPRYTVQTDRDGRYSIPLRAANGPYTVTAGEAPFVAAEISDISIVPQNETIQDIELRRDAPCLSAQPPAISEQLRLGEMVTKELRIDNTGAGLANVTLQLADFQPPLMTWASLDPVSAAIPAGDFQLFHLILDARTAALDEPGIYQARLLVEDDAWNLQIPINLEAVIYGVNLQAEHSHGAGLSGTTVSYTLALTNTGSKSDTFGLSAGSQWPVTLPETVGPLLPQEQQAIAVDVTIPAGAGLGDTNVATISARSQSAPDVNAVVQLESKVAELRLNLPVIMR